MPEEFGGLEIAGQHPETDPTDTSPDFSTHCSLSSISYSPPPEYSGSGLAHTKSHTSRVLGTRDSRFNAYVMSKHDKYAGRV